MASQDAELRLKVSLDLAFFRQEMQKVSNIASSEFTGRLAVKFNRQTLDTELNNLQKAIKRRTYRIEIGGNLDTAPSRVKSLKDALASLEGTKVNIDIGGIASIKPKEARKIRTALTDSILSQGGKIRVPTSIIAAITQVDVAAFKKAVTEKLSGIKVDVGINTPSAIISTVAKATSGLQAQATAQNVAPKKDNASQVIQGFTRSQLQNTRKAMVEAGMAVGDIKNLTKATVQEYQDSIVKGFTDSGKEAINGLAIGLKDPSSKISQAAAKVGEAGVNGIKDYLGIASPSTIFKQIGKFSVQGLEIGFLDSLQQFKNKSVAEIKLIVALLKMELAKVSDARPAIGSSTGSLRRQLLGSQAYSSPIGPLQEGSSEPWTRGRRGQFGYSGFEPAMVASAYGIPPNPLKSLGQAAQTQFQQAQSQARGPSPQPPANYSWFHSRAPFVPGPMMGSTGQQWSGAGTQRGVAPPPPPAPLGPLPPPSPPSPPSPPQPPAGGAGGFGGMGAFGRAMGGIQLPGAGLVREIGSEFAMAAKQVLLFGTAYKALAFLTSFPQQVGEAVGALQSFNNTLKAISPTAQEAATSNQFILDIVDRYNTPLQSARDGFTKLYASMAPAGFKGEEIRALFTGVSQAAATFGMSADKVDRVNYAFAQMASKGQVMSEELKGQLGDVLPGAMGIFAEAAGFKGPDAIQKFSKALEDGAYKGEAMRVLLKNVTTVLTKEFGPGAEGAARTFQGVINRMQNSTKLLYEAFEPVAVGFLNSVVVPMTGGLKTITDGFNAFFTGTQAKTAGGFAFAQELEKLKPAFEGIRVNVAALLPALQSFGSVVLEVSKVFLQIASNPFVGYLARVYLNVLVLTTAINILNLRALIPFIANLARSAFALVAFSAQMVVANQGLQLLKLTTQTAGITLRTFFATTGVGLVLVGIGLLIERFMSMNQKLEETRQKALGAADAIKSMSRVEARAADQQAQTAYSLIGNIAGRQLPAFSGGGKQDSDRFVPITEQELSQLSKIGAVETRYGTEGLLAKRSDVLSLAPQAQRLKSEAEYRQKQLQFEDQQSKVPSALLPVPGGGGKPGKEKSLESYYSLQDQLAKAQTQDEIDRIQSEFDYKTKLANSYYDLQEARANSFQKITIAFQKELFAIEQRRQQASISAQADVLKAQGSVAGGAGPTAGGAVPMTGGSATGAYLQGNIGPTSTGPHFDVKKMGRGYFPRDYLDQYVQVNGRPLSSGTTVREGTFAGHQKRGSHGWDYAFGEGRHAATLKGGAKWMEGRPTEHGEARKFQLPTGEMFQLLHGKSEGIGAGAPRQVPGSEKRDLLADQQAAIALRNQSASSLRAETIAAEESAIAIANYVAAIAPVAEQELQNQLLNKRIELMRTGVTGDYLETEIKIFEIREKQAFGIAAANQAIERNNKAVSDGLMSKEDANRLNAIQNKTIQDLITNIPKLITLTEQQAIAQEDLNFQTAKSDLNKQMKMAMALTPDAKLRVQLAEKYPGDTMKQEEEFAQTKMTEKAKKLEQDLQGIAASIGDSFGNAFKGIITGSMTAQQALAGFFQSIGDSFADMAAKMISEWLKVEAIKGIQNILGMLNPAGALGGAAAGGFSSGAAGFGGGFNSGIPALTGIPNFSGSFTKFATGGIVTGPTLGLVGEGRYNEAVVPLPDGKSIPVDLSGMGGGAGAISTNIVINVSNGQTQSNSSGGASDLGRKMEGAVKQVIVSELRPGGLLAGGRR